MASRKRKPVSLDDGGGGGGGDSAARALSSAETGGRRKVTRSAPRTRAPPNTTPHCHGGGRFLPPGTRPPSTTSSSSSSSSSGAGRRRAHAPPPPPSSRRPGSSATSPSGVGGGSGGGGSATTAAGRSRHRARGRGAARPRVWATLQRCAGESTDDAAAASASAGKAAAAGAAGGAGSRPVTPATPFGFADTDTDTDTDCSFGPMLVAGGGAAAHAAHAHAAAARSRLSRSPVPASVRSAASLRQISGEKLVVGRSSKCDFKVSDIRVSSQHCIIERDPDTHRPYIVNVSRNGIKVFSGGGRPRRGVMMKGSLERRPLDDGDRVVLLWAEPILSYTFRLAKDRTLASEYSVGKELGRGMFGTVYLGQSKHTQSAFAMKVINTAKLRLTSGSDSILGRLDQEVAIMHRLYHPHIIRVYDVFKQPDKVTLVMEYAPHGDLSQQLRLRKTGFSDALARDVFGQLCSAVHYLHTLSPKPIAHRDLKPDNILVASIEKAPRPPNGVKRGDPKIVVKLCDFGTSRSAGSSIMQTFVGTPSYAAPEIMTNSGHRLSVDIWSLGVLLFFMLFNQLPFKGGSVFQLAKQVEAGEFRFPDNRDDVVVAARALIRSMLQVTPADRPTAAEVQNSEWVAQ